MAVANLHFAAQFDQIGAELSCGLLERILWCTFEGVVAATLLIVGGSGALTALQAMAVSTGFPFTIVLLAMRVSLYLGLQQARTGG